MARQTFDDLSRLEQIAWEDHALEKFHAAGHSFADECPAEDRLSWIARNGRWSWEREHRNRLERWSDGWYGMTWGSHKNMFKNNYIGHRNSCTYVNGPKFYIPPRRGPWLAFLRWLQVVPPRRMTVRDAATFGSLVEELKKEPFE